MKGWYALAQWVNVFFPPLGPLPSHSKGRALCLLSVFQGKVQVCHPLAHATNPALFTVLWCGSCKQRSPLLSQRTRIYLWPPLFSLALGSELWSCLKHD